ncbi:MAG TPA: alpha/beta hydrolase [Burkholderiaceae bacterium]|nr:alpha/beta hydrolase [Burkholderiaceae bacterium]
MVSRTDMDDLRGISRMAFDAFAGLGGVVERMHTTIQQRPSPFGAAQDVPAAGVTGLVYRSVRGGASAIGTGVDALLASLAGLFPDNGRTDGREAMVAIVNGIYGDYLERTANPLAIGMSMRHGGCAVDPFDPTQSLRAAAAPPAASKVLVLVHGLCMNDLRWCREGHDHGAALASELGYSPLYLRYNTGLHISQNGRRFSDLLETLVQHWPVAVRELCIIGHSMGGLVARSACMHASQSGNRWMTQLRKLVFLGTPHFGSPLERGGHWLDFMLDLSPYSAPLTRAGKMRSAGIQDLRHGGKTANGDPIPLPQGVKCYAAAATLAKQRSLLADRLVGDGLVPLDSALGWHRDRSNALGIPKSRQWIGYEMGHLDMLCRPEVYEQLRLWIGE